MWGVKAGIATILEAILWGVESWDCNNSGSNSVGVKAGVEISGCNAKRLCRVLKLGAARFAASNHSFNTPQNLQFCSQFCFPLEQKHYETLHATSARHKMSLKTILLCFSGTFGGWLVGWRQRCRRGCFAE
jgi:hypothetical protein